MKLKLMDFSIQVKETIDLTSEGYRITGININAEIVVEKGYEKYGERCFQLATDYCHISRSIDQCIPIQYEFQVQSH